MRKIILIVLAAIALVSCGSSSNGIKPGQIVTTNQQCLAASSKESFDKLNKVCNRKDQSELLRMIDNKEAYVLNNATSIKITDLKFGVVIGEVQNGELSDEQVYMSREFIE